MKYDLNLLRAFDAIYTERNVSRAAGKLFLSQSALSAQLTRLRELFNDPLFIRQRHGVMPTEKAVHLHSAIVPLIEELDEVVQGEQEFTPAVSSMQFTIAGNDYFEYLVLPLLIARLAKLAPHITIAMQPLTQDVRETGAMSGKTQLVFGRLAYPPDNLVMKDVMTEHFSCLVSENHSWLENTLTLEEFNQLDHVVVKPATRLKTGLFKELAEHGITRQVRCEVTHFQYVPALIEQSNLIATLPTRICQAFTRTNQVRILPPPIALPGFPFQIGWHKRYQNDSAHTWLRNQIMQCCKDMEALKSSD